MSVKLRKKSKTDVEQLIIKCGNLKNVSTALTTFREKYANLLKGEE